MSRNWRARFWNKVNKTSWRIADEENAVFETYHNWLSQ
jgi:hypothetical protein